MSWIEPMPAASAFEAVLAHRPALLDRYRAFQATLRDAERVPPRIRELCRLRVAAVHGCAAEFVLREPGVLLQDHELAALHRGDTGPFEVHERAALALADAMPFRHHHVEDEDVARVRALFGDAGTVALLTAIAFFDVTCRLKLVLGVQPIAGDAEALHADVLA